MSSRSWKLCSRAVIGPAGRTATVLGMVAAGVTMLLGVAHAAAEHANLIDLLITAVIASLIVSVAWSARRLDARHRRTWAAHERCG